MTEEGLLPEEVNADCIIAETQKHLSDKGRSLWLRLLQEKKEGGVRTIDSYLRASLEQIVQQAKSKIEQARQSINKDVGD